MPTVECPKCEANLDAPAEYKGRNVRCAKCGHSFILRFSGQDMPTISVKVVERPPTKDDESTIVFREGTKPDSAGQQTPAPEKPGGETRDKP